MEEEAALAVPELAPDSTPDEAGAPAHGADEASGSEVELVHEAPRRTQQASAWTEHRLRQAARSAGVPQHVFGDTSTWRHVDELRSHMQWLLDGPPKEAFITSGAIRGASKQRLLRVLAATHAPVAENLLVGASKQRLQRLVRYWAVVQDEGGEPGTATPPRTAPAPAQAAATAQPASANSPAAAPAPATPFSPWFGTSASAATTQGTTPHTRQASATASTLALQVPADWTQATMWADGTAATATDASAAAALSARAATLAALAVKPAGLRDDGANFSLKLVTGVAVDAERWFNAKRLACVDLSQVPSNRWSAFGFGSLAEVDAFRARLTAPSESLRAFRTAFRSVYHRLGSPLAARVWSLGAATAFRHCRALDPTYLDTGEVVQQVLEATDALVRTLPVPPGGSQQSRSRNRGRRRRQKSKNMAEPDTGPLRHAKTTPTTHQPKQGGNSRRNDAAAGHHRHVSKPTTSS